MWLSSIIASKQLKLDSVGPQSEEARMLPNLWFSHDPYLY